MTTATTTLNTYDAQARAFLKSFGVRCTINPKGRQTCPKWDTDGKPCTHAGHGTAYRVTLSYTSPPPHPSPCAFDFWGSVNDRANHTDPTPYDVLACLSSDLLCPDTFADFCGDYGYDTDSRKALAQFRRCHAFAVRLNRFFQTDEIKAALSEIA